MAWSPQLDYRTEGGRMRGARLVLWTGPWPGRGLKAELTPVDRRLNMAFLCTLSSSLLELVMGQG